MNGKMQYTKFKHLIVMVLTLFVAMGLVVGSKTFDVFAATDVGDVHLSGVSEPAAGNAGTTRDEITVQESSKCLISNGDYKGNDFEVDKSSSSRDLSKYVFYDGVCWFNETDGVSLNKGDKFVSGKEYSVKIILVAKDGYYFPYFEAHSVTINGEKARFTILDKLDDDNDKNEYVLVEYSFASFQECKFYITVPTDGNIPSNSAMVLNDAQNYCLVNSVKWYKGSSNSTVVMGDDETFKAGDTYTVALVVTGNYGWTPSSKKSVYSCFGKAPSADIFGLAGQALIKFEFKAGKPLKSVEVVINAPVAGEKVNTEIVSISTNPAGVFSANEFDTSSDDIIEGNNYNCNDEESKVMAAADKYQRNKYYKSMTLNKVLLSILMNYMQSDNINGTTGISEDATFTIRTADNKFSKTITMSDSDATLYFGKLYEYIDADNIVIKVPVGGEKPDFNPTVSSLDKEKYKIRYHLSRLVHWYDVESGKELSYDSVFENGKKYKIEYYIENIESNGYKMLPTEQITKSVNGIKYEGNYHEFTFIANPRITEIKINVSEPEAGKKPGPVTFETTPENAFLSKMRAYTESTLWEESSDGKTYKLMEKDSVCKAGYSYRISPMLTILATALSNKDGDYIDHNVASEIDPTVQYYVNGKAVDTLDAFKYVIFEKIKAPATPTPTATPEVSPTPVVSPTPAVPTTSPVGIAAEGTELKDLEAVVVETDNDKDLKGAEYGKLQAKASKVTKKSIKLTWNQVEGADGYIVYGNKCSKNNKYVKIKELAGTKKSFTQKKLKKGTYYKYLVVAVKTVDGKQIVASTSKTIHAATKGGKVGNAKTIKIKNVSKNKKTIKLGKKFTLKTKQIAEKKSLKIKNHRKISFESSDTSIATVSSKGKIKAVGKGKCYIYVYAQNGVSTKVKITVK
ncbi:MAG: Ig-like domain-containing protein [Eubacterium sp.]|nr:Ig-like domain-containing protein [Eubacterium sp.]